MLDEGELWQRVGHDSELLREMLALFRNHSSLWLREIHSAIVEGNGAQLAAAAHGLKGSLSNFAANVACDKAGQLEEMATQNRLENDYAVALCSALEQEIAELEAQLSLLVTQSEFKRNGASY